MDKIVINPEYSEWIKSISLNFKQCQIKAASKVNEEMLLFYWKFGKDISKMNKLALYGSDFYSKISKDLRAELPDVKSFSVTNLRYIWKGVLIKQYAITGVILKKCWIP